MVSTADNNMLAWTRSDWFQVNNFVFSVTIHCLASKFFPLECPISVEHHEITELFKTLADENDIPPKLSRPFFTHTKSKTGQTWFTALWIEEES